MALFNANYGIVNLPVGTYNVGDLGDGLTASTVHQIYCISAGNLTLTARGGGQVTLSMTSGQTIDCVVKQVIVASGSFIGFRSFLNSRGPLYS